MDRHTGFSFVFVCQAGPLEAKSLLLAASLRKYLPACELVAAVPTPAGKWGTPAKATHDLLSELGARFVEIRNEIDPSYPIGNKVSCLRIATQAGRLIFADTDMLMTRALPADFRFEHPFAAKPADLPNVRNRRQWARAYSACKTAMPKGCVATTLYGQIVSPYFNAGLIVVDPATHLGDVWLDCCKKIDAKWGIELKRPHLDQIALPVAVQKLKLPYECLDERFNYPAHLKALDHDSLPFFTHYHSPEVLRREPMLVELVRELCQMHPALGQHLSADTEYAPILRERSAPAIHIRKAATYSQPTPELVITGIPRSGTSYLCNLLHRFDNCVVLNEPDGIGRSLRKEPIPHGVGTFFRNMRRDVVEGRPIRNKLRDGKVTDETMEANEQTEYVPNVIDERFVLGLKNPLGFLSRLHDLRRALPHARFVACIRNPYDTIASWKTTFAHLKTADVSKMTHGGLRDPFLSERHRSALVAIAGIKSPAWRRAAWWRFLAELVAGAGPDVIVVPYIRAVMDPVAVTDQILDGYNAGHPREPIKPSVVRAAKRDALDEEDLQAIRALCAEPVRMMGLDEGEAGEQTKTSDMSPTPLANAG